jgi:LDH2 family malate/lactate/ureidoglycolate dehydrogenase
MTGAMFGLSVFQDDQNYDVGHMMLAISPAAFMSQDEFDSRLEQLVAEVKEAPPIDSERPVVLPGEVEFERMTQREQDGIPVSRVTVDGLRDLAKDVGIEFTL